MRINGHFRPLLLIALCALSFGHPAAQVASSEAAKQVLQQTLKSLGGAPPSYVVISGTIAITGGSTPEDGPFKLIAKGVARTVESFDTPPMSRRLVYPDGARAEQMSL